MKHALAMLCAVTFLLVWSAQNINPPATPYQVALDRQRMDTKPRHEITGNGVTRFEYLDGYALEITDRGSMEPRYEEFRQ